MDKTITEKIISCAFNVHNTLGSGFLERVYENALNIELSRENLEVKQQIPVKVYYKGEVVGDYIVDLFVENCVIVEIKAVQVIIKEHEVQLVNYLAATGVDLGLLINFGSSVQIKRKYRNYTPKI